MRTDYSVAGIFQETETSRPWAMYNYGSYHTLEEAMEVADSYVRSGQRILDMWISKITYDSDYHVVDKQPVWHECFLDSLDNVRMPESILPSVSQK